MQPTNRTEVSNKERYKKYYKIPKNETAFSLVWTPIREYGIFVLPLIIAYLLIYFVVFEGGGKDEGNSAVYILIGSIIAVVTIAAFFLRKLIRSNRFYKYANSEISVYRGNRWVCPLCKNNNNLLAPCVKCGIYPALKKVNKEQPKDSVLKGYKKRNTKDYDEYVPQFEME